MTPPTKPKLDGFEFLDYLGGGAFGRVWKARDVKMDVLRAVKVLPREHVRDAEVRRLLEEAQTMAKLPKHRHRVACHHFKEGVANCFLVMDYVAGGPLSRLVAAGRPLPWARAARFAADVGDALADVHARGLLHCDVKPDNVLLEPEPDEAVLADFGIAVALAGADGRAAGTRGYIAPEAYRGGASAKSDVFSLAATLLHLVTGERPREHAPPPDGPAWQALPDGLRAALLAGLEPDPARRADLAGFLALLREARWHALTSRALADVPDEAPPVRLRAAVTVAHPNNPSAFRPLLRDGRPQPATTGDLVRVEAQADADGHLTVLLLGSSGGLDVGFPDAGEAPVALRAGQRCDLVFRLTPPAGTERVLVHWSAKPARHSAAEWRRWLERAGLTDQGPAEAARPGTMRGIEVVHVEKHRPPEGSYRLLVIPVPHDR